MMGEEGAKSDYFEHLDKKKHREKYRKRVPLREVKGIQ
jgi:hypothetical protein